MLKRLTDEKGRGRRGRREENTLLFVKLLVVGPVEKILRDPSVCTARRNFEEDKTSEVPIQDILLEKSRSIGSNVSAIKFVSSILVLGDYVCWRCFWLSFSVSCSSSSSLRMGTKVHQQDSVSLPLTSKTGSINERKRRRREIPRERKRERKRKSGKALNLMTTMKMGSVK